MPSFAVDDRRLGEAGMPVVRDADAGLFQRQLQRRNNFVDWLERIPACICSTCGAPKTDSWADTFSMVVHPSKSIEGDDRLHYMAGRQHLKRKEVKEHRKELWEKKRKETRGAHSSYSADLVRRK